MLTLWDVIVRRAGARRGADPDVLELLGQCCKVAVLTIDLRYTMLDGEGKTIFVPNFMMFTSAITVEPLAAAPGPAPPDEPSASPPKLQ